MDTSHDHTRTVIDILERVIAILDAMEEFNRPRPVRVIDMKSAYPKIAMNSIYGKDPHRS